jgi:ElaB/YqjD/DUF883 family membrane-anchored ribosome-binding protein
LAQRAHKKASQIEGFAEDLGTLLGSATAKAESWLNQRQQIVKRLTEVRDTASKLLTDLGHQAQSAVAAGTAAYGKRRGRPAGSKNKATNKGIIIVGGKGRRKMSAKARKAISMAQKARWAKVKAGSQKK